MGVRELEVRSRVDLGMQRRELRNNRRNLDEQRRELRRDIELPSKGLLGAWGQDLRHSHGYGWYTFLPDAFQPPPMPVRRAHHAMRIERKRTSARENPAAAVLVSARTFFQDPEK